MKKFIAVILSTLISVNANALMTTLRLQEFPDFKRIAGLQGVKTIFILNYYQSSDGNRAVTFLSTKDHFYELGAVAFNLSFSSDGRILLSVETDCEAGSLGLQQVYFNEYPVQMAGVCYKNGDGMGYFALDVQDEPLIYSVLKKESIIAVQIGDMTVPFDTKGFLDAEVKSKTSR